MLAQDTVLGFLAGGVASSFFFGVIFFAFVYTMITRARAGVPIPEIRKLSGIEAVDEAVGRSTEMGKPVIFHPGRADLRNPQTIGGFAMLGYVSSMCARYDVRLIQIHWHPMVLAVCEEITRQSYLEAGRPDSFNISDVMYIGDATAPVMGVIEREEPGAQVYWGAFWAESLNLIEVGAMVGAIQIGATANEHQIPFFVAGCDYALIGEEMYAASAYISKEPVLVGTIVGQDWAKMLLIAFILGGTLLSTALGSTDHFLTRWFQQ